MASWCLTYHFGNATREVAGTRRDTLCHSHVPHDGDRTSPPMNGERSDSAAELYALSSSPLYFLFTLNLHKIRGDHLESIVKLVSHGSTLKSNPPTAARGLMTRSHVLKADPFNPYGMAEDNIGESLVIVIVRGHACTSVT